jgi:hypothetical protein
MEVSMRSFQSALEAGQSAERRWVEEIRKLGRSAMHGKKLVVKQHCKNTGHVETPDALGLFAIEIKERSLSFNDPESFPFDTVFVDDLRGMSMEKTQNLIYIYLSKPTGQWCWLSILDRDDTWSEGKTFDRGRGHEVPVLIAPKSALRPAQTLIDLLYPHAYLDLVDGETGGFVRGGGKTEVRDRYVAKDNPGLETGNRKPQSKAGKRLGEP